MATASANTPPWVYFLSGTIVPSLAWLLQRSKASNRAAEEEDEDDEDEDTAGISTGGPSSKWGYADAPYKVRMVWSRKQLFVSPCFSPSKYA